MSEREDFRHLVRIHGKDLDGGKKVGAALSDLRGVGDNFARTITMKVGLDPRARLGTLTDEQLKGLEKALNELTSLGIPSWFFNRRRDPETGESKQVIGTDLDFALKTDLEREKEAQSWKGIRHGLGLKVRGQRTRTTGRKGRTVGVRKASLIAAAKAAKTAEEEKK
jgi:small subunit ribosomal protein S13